MGRPKSTRSPIFRDRTPTLGFPVPLDQTQNATCDRSATCLHLNGRSAPTCKLYSPHRTGDARPSSATDLASRPHEPRRPDSATRSTQRFRGEPDLRRYAGTGELVRTRTTKSQADPAALYAAAGDLFGISTQTVQRYLTAARKLGWLVGATGGGNPGLPADSPRVPASGYVGAHRSRESDHSHQVARDDAPPGLRWSGGVSQGL